MDSALGQWLSLREAADWAARADGLLQRLESTWRATDVLGILDLCTGTGSNLRYLMDRLPGRQDWLVVDRDPLLLDQLWLRTTHWASERNLTVRQHGATVYLEGARSYVVERRQMDLGTLDAAIFARRHLVTASALLDLVSANWLRDLAHRCRDAGAAALFTISYNGRSTCSPADSDDEFVLRLFNRHQLTDKGLGGPAAGPEASEVAEGVFREVGYQVERAPSNWSLGPHAHEFQRQLIEGWASASREVAPEQADRIDRWLARRLEHVSGNRSRIQVCHDDVVAWLEAGR